MAMLAELGALRIVTTTVKVGATELLDIWASGLVKAALVTSFPIVSELRVAIDTWFVMVEFLSASGVEV